MSGAKKVPPYGRLERLLRGERDEPKKEVPTFAEFAKTFMATYARSNNKPSECEAKRSILTIHLLPAFGSRRLGEITVRTSKP